MASKNKVNEDIYKRLNAQLMGRLKKAEKELTIVQTSLDKVTMANKKLERMLHTYEEHLASLSESTSTSASFNKRTLDDYLSLHRVLDEQLSITCALVRRLTAAVGANGPSAAGTCAEDAASSPSDKKQGEDDMFRGCEQNINQLIEIRDKLQLAVEHVVKHIEQEGTTSRALEIQLPESVAQAASSRDSFCGDNDDDCTCLWNSAECMDETIEEIDDVCRELCSCLPLKHAFANSVIVDHVRKIYCQAINYVHDGSMAAASILMSELGADDMASLSSAAEDENANEGNSTIQVEEKK